MHSRFKVGVPSQTRQNRLEKSVKKAIFSAKWLSVRSQTNLLCVQLALQSLT